MENVIYFNGISLSLHLGMEFTKFNGKVVRCFQLIDGPLPNGKAHAIIDFEGGTITRQLFSCMLSKSVCEEFHRQCCVYVDSLQPEGEKTYLSKS